jgi:hypothetical protein
MTIVAPWTGSMRSRARRSPSSPSTWSCGRSVSQPPAPKFNEDRSQWPEQHAWLLERLEAFKQTFAERVRALDLGQDDEEPDDIEETA